MKIINELNKYFCKLLKIKEIPVVEITTEEMCQLAGDETLACYHNLEKRIYIIAKEEYTLTDFYLLAHELRHAWQHVKDPNFYFGDYDSDMSIHEYHTSVAEIDANAFACIAIAIGFGKITKRIYKSNTEAANLYERRLNELKEEFGIEF